MTYDEIYQAFYLIVDKDFFSLDKDIAHEYMRKWIHNAFSEIHIRELFTSISLDDEIEELSFELKDHLSKYSDINDFVKNIISKYMKIAWITQNVDTGVNLALVIGGKDEKKLQSNYVQNIARIKGLTSELRKLITDYNSNNNSYIGGV